MTTPDSTLAFTEHGAGPPLLLVHGLMITGEMFEPIVPALAARYRVIVPDLRGHGRSRALGPPYTVAQLAADLAELLDRLGIETAAVLGYSQGGAVAQQLALDHPVRCSRLILACTYAFNMATRREQVEGRLVPALIRLLGMRYFAKLVIALGLTHVEKSRARWVVELIAAQDGGLMRTAWREAMAFDSRPRLGAIRCPTLVIAGAADEAVPFHHAWTLHQGIAGSQLQIVDGADHALAWTHPEVLVRAVATFLG